MEERGHRVVRSEKEKAASANRAVERSSFLTRGEGKSYSCCWMTEWVGLKVDLGCLYIFLKRGLLYRVVQNARKARSCSIFVPCYTDAFVLYIPSVLCARRIVLPPPLASSSCRQIPRKETAEGVF